MVYSLLKNKVFKYDGYAIENLLFNILWYLCPELIINGHVYSSVPPLFRITTKKNEYLYIKDNEELEDYKKTNGNDIATIGRMKG
jgi:DNA gyrase subunit B